MSNPNDRQIGGQHYQGTYQHWDLITDYSIGYLEGNATKYLMRWRKKNGRQDLEKAIHYIDKLVDNIQNKQQRPTGVVPYAVFNKFVEGYPDMDVVTSSAMSGILMWANARDSAVPLTTAKRLIQYLIDTTNWDTVK